MNKIGYINHSAEVEGLTSKEDNSNSQIVDLLSDVIIELRRSNTIAETLGRKKTYWTAEDIAFQIGKSKSTVQSRYTCKPNFPKARRLPSEKGKGHPVWLASEIMAWIEKHKER